MLTLPAALLSLLREFAPLFSRPVWKHVQVLLVGVILAPVKATGPCAPGTPLRPIASVRGEAPAAALPSCAGGRGIVNACCPPRHLEPLLRLCGQAAPRRVQRVVPGLSRAIARRVSRVNTGGNTRRCRIVCTPMAWQTARLRAAQVAPDRAMAMIDTCEYMARCPIITTKGCLGR